MSEIGGAHPVGAGVGGVGGVDAGDGRVRALLFDLDGTLVDTREANHLAYAEALAEQGYDVSVEELDATWGRDSRDFLPDVAPGITPEGVDAVRAAKALAYERIVARLGTTRLNGDLVAMLRLLAPGHRTALVTTAKTANGRQVLDAHGIAPLFDVTVFGDDVERGKPHPEAYERALAALGVEAPDALAFEDSATGIAAAVAAGIRVVEVPRF